MDVVIRPGVARRLLHPVPGSEDDYCDVLGEVGPELDIWKATSTNFDAAETVWNRLRKLEGIDWVTAGKLLARKRPRLIPVIDSVVVRALAAPDNGYWDAYHDALQHTDRRAHLDAIRPSDLPLEISALRVLDAAIWMAHSEGRHAVAARQELDFQID